MANYTTGAQRYNKRMDKIMEHWRENEKKRKSKKEVMHDIQGRELTWERIHKTG